MSKHLVNNCIDPHSGSFILGRIPGHRYRHIKIAKNVFLAASFHCHLLITPNIPSWE